MTVQKVEGFPLLYFGEIHKKINVLNLIFDSSYSTFGKSRLVLTADRISWRNEKSDNEILLKGALKLLLFYGLNYINEELFN